MFLITVKKGQNSAIIRHLSFYVVILLQALDFTGKIGSKGIYPKILE